VLALPLYEYECSRCHHRFEKLQRFSDPPPDACPKCGGPVTQVLSPAAIQFKGSGWYVTDYARKSSGPPPGKTGEKAEKSGEKPAESGSGAKRTESKPATGKSSQS
jgi:putative FmdB family regulatory protein